MLSSISISHNIIIKSLVTSCWELVETCTDSLTQIDRFLVGHGVIFSWIKTPMDCTRPSSLPSPHFQPKQEMLEEVSRSGECIKWETESEIQAPACVRARKMRRVCFRLGDVRGGEDRGNVYDGVQSRIAKVTNTFKFWLLEMER